MSKIRFNWTEIIKAVGTLIVSVLSSLTITSCLNR